MSLVKLFSKRDLLYILLFVGIKYFRGLSSFLQYNSTTILLHGHIEVLI
jgi:hypothetical protein